MTRADPNRIRVAWIHAFNGVAGDMLLGALLDAGADVDEVRAIVDVLGVPGWSLTTESVLRGGLAATRAVVSADDDATHRPASTILDLVADADLPARVAERATAVFRRLAEVEGRRHGVAPADVHFHEVGGLDAIVDVVGCAAALEVLGVDEVHAGPVATGVGTTASAHGVLPVPAPAVVDLLVGAPVRHVDVPVELTTPTGAALVSTLAVRWGPLPAMTLTGAGYGAGTRDLDGRVNAVQVVLGTTAASGSVGGDQAEPLVELVANVDDATGETLGHTVEELLAAGALDAWVVPVVMKKGRPGHVVHALTRTPDAAEVARTLTHETGSLGVRAQTVERWPARRRMASVEVDGHTVRVKVTDSRTKAEHDDAAAVARATGRPLREVVSLAEEAARRRPPRDDRPDEPA